MRVRLGETDGEMDGATEGFLLTPTGGVFLGGLEGFTKVEFWAETRDIKTENTTLTIM